MPGSRSFAARSTARNRSVLVGLSNGALGASSVWKCTAVSATIRRSVASIESGL
jgi:hypothetical protein